MFTKAARKGSHLKLAITGPSGSGKTYSALRLATGISKEGRIAFIDTEIKARVFMPVTSPLMSSM